MSIESRFKYFVYTKIHKNTFCTYFVYTSIHKNTSWLSLLHNHNHTCVITYSFLKSTSSSSRRIKQCKLYLFFFLLVISIKHSRKEYLQLLSIESKVYILCLHKNTEKYFVSPLIALAIIKLRLVMNRCKLV